MEPNLTLSTAAAESAIAAKTAPKVTKESITARIAGTSFLHHNTTTICLIVMENGFEVDGKSGVASPENYDAAIGERLAYDDAFRKLWAFEGYLLKEQLWSASKPALPPPPEPSPQP